MVMAAPRPVKGILKNKSSIKARPEEPVQDTPEPGAPINSEDDPQWVTLTTLVFKTGEICQL